MDKRSIYIAERDHTCTAGRPHFHCFLILCDESSGSFEKATVLEQLHFVEDLSYPDTETPKMIHERRIRTSSPKCLQDCKLSPVLSGDTDFINAIWEHAITFAETIDNNDIHFGHDYMTVVHANNCRSAIKETLRVCGLPFNDKASCEAHGQNFAPGLESDHIRRTLSEFPILTL